MKQKELKELSELAQIELAEVELPFFFATFRQLEEMLISSALATELPAVLPMERILTNHLELCELGALYAKHQVHKLSNPELSANAPLSEEGNFKLARAKHKQST